MTEVVGSSDPLASLFFQRCLRHVTSTENLDFDREQELIKMAACPTKLANGNLNNDKTPAVSSTEFAEKIRSIFSLSLSELSVCCDELLREINKLRSSEQHQSISLTKSNKIERSNMSALQEAEQVGIGTEFNLLGRYCCVFLCSY
jgi:hypothetical protein